MQRRELGRIARREPEADQPALATLVHVRLELLHPLVPLGDGGRLPRAGGEDDQGVEDLLVEAGRVGQDVVAALDGDRFAGVFPLVQVKSRLFGNIACSMPFVNYGGPCAIDVDVEGLSEGRLARKDLARKDG